MTSNLLVALVVALAAGVLAVAMPSDKLEQRAGEENSPIGHSKLLRGGASKKP